jgi:5-methylthioadenosine/S-adenosylhomocysteine deaminase
MDLFVNGAELDGRPVSVHVANGVIAAIEDTLAGPGPTGPAGPASGADVIDGRGLTLLPGLVNGHTHAAMTLFRGYGDDLPLMTWLKTRIWPAEARLTADDVYWGTRLACLEMARSGTTRFFDMYWHPEAVARAATDAGLRAVVAAPLLDEGTSSGPSGLKDDALGSLDQLASFGDHITASLGPHAVYTVSPSSLEWIGQVAQERDLPVQIHLAETRREVDDCVDQTGLRPGELVDRCGLLGPRTVLAHGCWLEPHELEVIAERGATIVTNPVSNMKLAVGRQFPYADAVQARTSLGLGTDGAASNNSLDLFQDMKIFALAQKFANDDPAMLRAAEVLAVARGQRSALLGGHPIEVGAPGDFILVRRDEPEIGPGDLDANLVYAATGAVVDTLVVDGRVVMRHRQVDGAEEIVDQVRGRVSRLTAG